MGKRCDILALNNPMRLFEAIIEAKRQAMASNAGAG